MRPFRNLVQDPRLWAIRRKNTVPAFSFGAFLACMPFPGQPLIAVAGAWALHINIPVAVLVTFTSNPVTMGPLYYAAYRVGSYLLRMPTQPFEIEMSIEWVFTTFVSVWQPLLLGCILLGSIVALVAYIVLDLLWRNAVVTYKQRKRRKREAMRRDSGDQ